MKLFIKIFLWFLVAIAITIYTILIITRTFQTDPLLSRIQRGTRNQMTIFSGTATQIAAAEGEQGLRDFLSRLRDTDPPRKVDLVDADGSTWFGDRDMMADTDDLVGGVFASGTIDLDISSEERTVGAAPVTFPDGRRFVLLVQWERTLPPPMFYGSTPGYLRLAALLVTAVIACVLLALYLSTPIRRLREATNRFAAGDLSTRVGGRVKRRRDEIADLARDFDKMAERIESLINNQQRLNRDISHELRSPLARLNVSLEIAKQRANEETAPMLDRIERESTRLNEMISRILTLAKLESGSVEYERTPLSFTELVTEVAEDANFEAQANGRHVVITESDECVVSGNEILLRSAVENILRNAVRHTAEGTAVDVRLMRNNGTALLRISDHGGGVPEDEIENLFKPFYRVSDARERKTGGIGLGLAIAQRAIEAHSGNIRAKNVPTGLEIEIELKAASDRRKMDGVNTASSALRQ